MTDSDSENDLITETVDAIRVVTINRADRMNAITVALWCKLDAEVEAFTANPDCKVMVIRGAGERAFASGSDIDEMPTLYANPETSADYDRTLLATQSRLANSPKPVIAMIFGYCVGGGLGIATACDLRFAARNAKFSLPPAKLGLINGVSSMRRLILLIGLAATRDLLYSGRLIDADDAWRLGLIDRLVDQDKLEDLTMDYARQVAENSQFSVRASKQLTEQIGSGRDQDDDAVWELVRDSVSGEDFAEGFQAFKEKRKPKFPHR